MPRTIPPDPLRSNADREAREALFRLRDAAELKSRYRLSADLLDRWQSEGLIALPDTQLPFAIEAAHRDLRENAALKAVAHVAPTSQGKLPSGAFEGIRYERIPVACTYAEIGLQPTYGTSAEILDLDGPDARRPLDRAIAAGRVPRPSWITTRIDALPGIPAGGLHVGWSYTFPVGHANDVAMRRRRRIRSYLVQTLRADPGYSAHLTHNPVSPIWQTEWNPRSFTLDDFEAFLPKGYRTSKKAAPAIVGEGRNVSIFRECCRIVGADLDLDPHDVCRELNESIPGELGKAPLGDKELAGIARSVARYKERWTPVAAFWESCKDADVQRARQALSVASRRQNGDLDARDAAVVAMRESGMWWSEIEALDGRKRWQLSKIYRKAVCGLP